MRIILDKSVVRGLSNDEVDALDRYFFQIVPPILQNEILADLTKVDTDAYIEGKIAGQSYRIAGNSGIAESCRELLGQSLIGNDPPMDGRFVPAQQHLVRTDDGKVGIVIDSRVVEEKIARWERKDFISGEREAASKWRDATSRQINVKMYADKITAAGLDIPVLRTDEEVREFVNQAANDERMQGTLLYLLFREWRAPYEFQKKVLVRWGESKRPPIREFAPYAFYCARVAMTWATIGLTKQKVFKPDKNDCKDMEYCYYLPFTEIFASGDKKHLRIVPLLMRPDQNMIDRSELKSELSKLAASWNQLTRDEQILQRRERSDAPPENSDSLAYQLWLKHRGKIRTNLLGLENAMVVDSRLPEDQQVPTRFGDLLNEWADKIDAADRLGPQAVAQLQAERDGADPTTFAMRRSLFTKERAKKQFPELTDADLDSSR